MAPLVAQSVKSLPAMLEAQVRSLDWEDPLKKEMASHSSILAWEILWTEEPAGLQYMGSQSRTRLSTYFPEKLKEGREGVQEENQTDL